MFVGIDVSKAWLDIAQWQDGKPLGTIERQQNSVESTKNLAESLQGAELVVVEATGGYEQFLVEALLEQAVPVSVVNPKRVRDFAKSMGKLAKTDRIDAVVLAEYASLFNKRLNRVIVKKDQELKSLCALRQDVVQSVTQTKNRLRKAPITTQCFLKETLQHLKAQLKAIDQQMAALLRNCPHSQILLAVTGVGPVLTATLIAQLPELGHLNGKEIAALTGVAPFNCDSGTMRGRRRIWGGRRSVRTILYMGTFSATRHNPIIKAYYDQLIARGKPFKVAMTACTRKFLVILNAKMRDYYKLKSIGPEPQNEAA